MNEKQALAKAKAYGVPKAKAGGQRAKGQTARALRVFIVNFRNYEALKPRQIVAKANTVADEIKKALAYAKQENAHPTTVSQLTTAYNYVAALTSEAGASRDTLVRDSIRVASHNLRFALKYI